MITNNDIFSIIHSLKILLKHFVRFNRKRLKRTQLPRAYNACFIFYRVQLEMKSLSHEMRKLTLVKA